MNRRTAAAALTALAILPLAACSNAFTTTDELSYQIDQSPSALVIDARAGSIAIEVGDGLSPSRSSIATREASPQRPIR